MSDILKIFNLFIILALLISFKINAQEHNSQAVIAENFSAMDIYGEEIVLSQQLAAKPVMLYFWATWCPYCKKETPKLVTFNKNFAEKINVIGINVGVNDSVAKIHDYVREFDVNFPIVYDESQLISPAYGVNGTPVFVVISQSQQILYRGHRFPAGIEQALEN